MAFWRRRGFAYLWRPGQYLRHPTAEIKQVVHSASTVWMYHLEIHSVDVDREVEAWLLEGTDAAG